MSKNDELSGNVKFLRQAFDNSEASVIIINQSGEIVLSNKRAQEVTAYSAEEFLNGKTWKDLIVADDQDEFFGYLQLLKANPADNSQRLEVNFYDKEGGIHSGLMSAYFVSDENLIAVSVIDISEQKEYEFMLEKAKEAAEDSEKMKAAFLANMSHEIRTPINGIVGFADLLKLDNLSEDKKNLYLDQVIHGSYDLLRLIEKLITISRIDSGQLKINNREFDLNVRLRDLEDKMHEELVNRGKESIQLSFNPGVKEDKYLIFGDPIRLNEVLTNLLENSVKFTESGHIEFGYYVVENAPDSKEGESLIFFVKDSGIGIDKAKKKIVFDRFVKVIEKDDTIDKGAGLGLSICKEVTALFGGSLWLESTKGSGSRFFFNYPLSKNSEKNRNEINGDPAKKSLFDWSGKKILIAEDVESNYLYIKELISSTNVEILRARDGIEAVDLFESNPSIDLVVMDILMPGMDGHEATNAIRKVRPEIPVIAQSAFTFEGDIKNGLYAGCFNDYIMKPYTRKLLLAVINKYFCKE